MSKISKTAKASIVTETKAKKVETPEEAIHQLRLNVEAGLFVGDNSRIKHLLAAHDELLSRVGTKEDASYWCKEAERLIAKYEPEGVPSVDLSDAEDKEAQFVGEE